MPTDKAIDALCKDAERAARLASYLLALADAEWSEWELTYLTGIIERTSALPLSYRQGEKLLKLENRTTWLTKVGGLSVASLVRDCWLLRYGLDADDEIWVDGLYRARTSALRRGGVRRLLALLRQVDADLLDGYVALDGAVAA